MQLFAALAESIRKILLNSIGHQKLRILGPSISALGAADFLLSQGLAMSFLAVLLVRCSKANVAVHDDERRAILCFGKSPDGTFEHAQIVGITHTQHVPSVAEEAGAYILAESQIGL